MPAIPMSRDPRRKKIAGEGGKVYMCAIAIQANRIG